MLPASALDVDAVFDQPFTGGAARQIYVQRGRMPGQDPKLACGLALLAFAAVARRRPRR